MNGPRQAFSLDVCLDYNQQTLGTWTIFHTLTECQDCMCLWLCFILMSLRVHVFVFSLMHLGVWLLNSKTSPANYILYTCVYIYIHTHSFGGKREWSYLWQGKRSDANKPVEDILLSLCVDWLHKFSSNWFGSLFVWPIITCSTKVKVDHDRRTVLNRTVNCLSKMVQNQSITRQEFLHIHIYIYMYRCIYFKWCDIWQNIMISWYICNRCVHMYIYIYIHTQLYSYVCVPLGVSCMTNVDNKDQWIKMDFFLTVVLDHAFSIQTSAL